MLQQILNSRMSLKTILTINNPLRRQIQYFSTRSWFKFGSKAKVENVVDITSAEEKPVFIKEEDLELEQKLESKRNKSRLAVSHRNILNNEPPYQNEAVWYQNTVRYKKRMIGRYGIESVGIPAGVAWPTPEEVEDTKEYERVAFPLSLQERWEKLRQEHEEHELAVKNREKQIAENMSNMKDWIRELNEKRDKKERQLRIAIERKEALINEVRRHFGFKISINDDRFKEMLAKKEKEDRKQQKEAKKKAKDELMFKKVQAATKGEQIGEESVK